MRLIHVYGWFQNYHSKQFRFRSLTFIAYREIVVKTIAFRVDLRFASCKSVFCKVLQPFYKNDFARNRYRTIVLREKLGWHGVELNSEKRFRRYFFWMLWGGWGGGQVKVFKKKFFLLSYAELINDLISY